MNGRTKTENTENKEILNGSTKKNRGRKREDGQRDVKPQQRRGRNRQNHYQKITPKKTIRSKKI